MNLVLDTNNFNFANIFLNESIKNTVMNDSSFIRILYSNEHIILNGIYIKILFENEINMEKFLENQSNKIAIAFIEKVEKHIFTICNIHKVSVYKTVEQLKFLVSKFYIDKKQGTFNLIFKISGIWETHTNKGLTFKFIDINRL